MAAMVAILKFFKQHLLNPKSSWAETWWEASQWHRDSEWLKSFRWYPRWPPPSWNSSNNISKTISQIALKLSMAAILKFFNRHLPNRKLDWAETWWEASQWHRNSELLKYTVPISKMAATAAILKFFKWYLLQNYKSDWAETLWEALERHRDSELLRLFGSDIQDGHHGGPLEILQTTSPPRPKIGLSQNLMGSITVTQRFRIAKIVPFRCPGGHLEIFQMTSYPKQ